MYLYLFSFAFFQKCMMYNIYIAIICSILTITSCQSPTKKSLEDLINEIFNSDYPAILVPTTTSVSITTTTPPASTVSVSNVSFNILVKIKNHVKHDVFYVYIIYDLNDRSVVLVISTQNNARFIIKDRSTKY